MKGNIEKFLKAKYFVPLLMVIALAMRLVVINQSLWLDEAIGAIVVRDYSYGQILTDFLQSDNHPPLYYLDLKSWTSVFGYSEIALRFHSVIYGILTVYLTYLIAEKISGNKNRIFPILATILIATSPFHIYYSQEARMYSLAAFLASLSIYSFLLLLSEKKNEYNWQIIFSFSITALVFADYVPIFLLPIFWIVGFVSKKDKKWWRNFILTHVPIAIFGILWLPTLLIQAEKGKWLMETLPAWKQVAGGASFKQAVLVWMKFVLGRISLINKKLYYFLVLVASVPITVSITSSLRHKSKKFDIVWLWLIFPLVFGFVISFWFPAFVYFRFVYVVPAFYLIISQGVATTKSKLTRNILIGSLILANITGWLIYVSDDNQQREQWKQSVDFVESNAKENDIVIFEYPEPFAPYRWYAKGSVNAFGVTDSISANPVRTAIITKKTIESRNGVYYFEYLRDLSDPERVVEKVLEESGFKVVKYYNDFPGVGLIAYWERVK